MLRFRYGLIIDLQLITSTSIGLSQIVVSLAVIPYPHIFVICGTTLLIVLADVKINNMFSNIGKDEV